MVESHVTGEAKNRVSHIVSAQTIAQTGDAMTGKLVNRYSARIRSKPLGPVKKKR